MTADGLAGEVRVPDLAAGGPTDALPVATILATCDRVLGEIGRSSHLFGWLRDPAAGPQQWLSVDAYYPASRLVVLCHQQPSPHEHLCGELIPAHGLRLLVLDPAQLRQDPAGPRAAIERMIAGLGELRDAAPREAPLPPDQPRESVVARAVASLSQPVARPVPERSVRPSGPRAAAAERAARFVSARERLQERPAPAGRIAPPGRSAPAPTTRSRPTGGGPPSQRLAPRRGPAAQPLQPPSLLVGAALAVVLCAEIYLGVEVAALGSGQVLLAFGIALDGCARALGTIAAARVRRRDWTWLCVIGGSPAVASFALFASTGPVDAEPAPLAGLLSLLAGATIVIALLGRFLGI